MCPDRAPAAIACRYVPSSLRPRPVSTALQPESWKPRSR
jgi:hypothetical protein